MGNRVSAANIKLKRVYEAKAPADGLRILVDRLWPRGVTKAAAALDRWDKEAAPSPLLRAWFGHDPVRWTTFSARYAAELRASPGALHGLQALAREHPITLVYAAHDRAHTHAIVLRNLILGRAPT